MDPGILPPRGDATPREALAWIRRIQLVVAALAIVAAVVVWEEGYRWLFLAGAVAAVWSYAGLGRTARRAEAIAPEAFDRPVDPEVSREHRRRALPRIAGGLLVVYAAVGYVVAGPVAAAVMAALVALAAAIALAVLRRR